jgi:hypothetical protein
MKHETQNDHKAQTHIVICDGHAECTRKHTSLLRRQKRRKIKKTITLLHKNLVQNNSKPFSNNLSLVQQIFPVKTISRTFSTKRQRDATSHSTLTFITKTWLLFCSITKPYNTIRQLKKHTHTNQQHLPRKVHRKWNDISLHKMAH